MRNHQHRSDDSSYLVTEEGWQVLLCTVQCKKDWSENRALRDTTLQFIRLGSDVFNLHGLSTVFQVWTKPIKSHNSNPDLFKIGKCLPVSTVSNAADKTTRTMGQPFRPLRCVEFRLGKSILQHSINDSRMLVRKRKIGNIIIAYRKSYNIYTATIHWIKNPWPCLGLCF